MRTKLLKILAITLTQFITPLPVFAIPDILFIVDASGSMSKRMSTGRSQMQEAVAAVSEAVKGLPPDVLVGIRAYGHRVSKDEQTKSCADTELILPFQNPDSADVLRVLRKLKPLGQTAITRALKEARNDLYDVGVGRNAEKMIVLLSDGDETCGGDPVKILEQFRQEGFFVQVNIVGFNVDQATRAQLESMSNVSNGKYFDAKNPDELNDALKDAVTADNVGSCGLGSKIFDGQRGIAPQVLAVTTNASLGNQTFGISFGTSGCTQDGAIVSNWRTAIFLRENMVKVAQDAATGGGETLTALAELLKIERDDRQHFFSSSKLNFAELFESGNTSSADLRRNWKRIFHADPVLARYAQNWG